MGMTEEFLGQRGTRARVGVAEENTMEGEEGGEWIIILEPGKK